MSQVLKFRVVEEGSSKKTNLYLLFISSVLYIICYKLQYSFIFFILGKDKGIFALDILHH